MAVDTHILRIGTRIGLAPAKTPDAVGHPCASSRPLHAPCPSLADPARALCLPRRRAGLPRLRHRRYLQVAGKDDVYPGTAGANHELPSETAFTEENARPGSPAGSLAIPTGVVGTVQNRPNARRRRRMAAASTGLRLRRSACIIALRSIIVHQLPLVLVADALKRIHPLLQAGMNHRFAGRDQRNQPFQDLVVAVAPVVLTKARRLDQAAIFLVVSYQSSAACSSVDGFSALGRALQAVGDHGDLARRAPGRLRENRQTTIASAAYRIASWSPSAVPVALAHDGFLRLAAWASAARLPAVDATLIDDRAATTASPAKLPTIQVRHPPSAVLRTHGLVALSAVGDATLPALPSGRAMARQLQWCLSRGLATRCQGAA